MKPICVPCRRFYRPKKNGISFVESMPKVNGALPGNAAPNQWRPYKLWMADLWECPDCGGEILVGNGNQPISEHYEPDFAEQVRTAQPLVTINDC